MKKLITIILAIIMSLFPAQQKGSDEPPMTAEKPLQTAITTTVEHKYPKRVKWPQKRRLWAKCAS